MAEGSAEIKPVERTPEEKEKLRAAFRSMQLLGEEKERTRIDKLLRMTMKEAIREFERMQFPRSSALRRLSAFPSPTTIAMRDYLNARKRAIGRSESQ